MMHNTRKLFGRGLAVFVLLGMLVGCPQSRTRRSTEMLSGPTMGTSYTVKYLPGRQTIALVEVAARVEEELESVNAQMSTYREDSELSRFNEQTSLDWFAVSPQTAQVVQLALEIHQQTAGAFDVTVGPLVDLWGFGPSQRPDNPPDAEQIQQLLDQVGSDKLQVQLDPPALKKLVPGLRVDLSAIAKGQGVDRVALLLEELGIEHYFVEVGGEVRTRGRRQDGQPWQVGIERPDPDRRELQHVVGLSNLSMATSGDYRNFWESEGRAYSHFIDPRTGHPALSEIASATVLAADCATADALATGLMSSGLENALQLIQEHDWAALLIVRRQDRLETLVSPRFSELTGLSITPNN